ncbi:hypothetical protein JCM9279_006777 [Rhodotorula babjevae]
MGSIDPPTLALGSAVVLALFFNYTLRPPPPQVHPFLLGRQSLPAPTRNEGESPVYTSSANGGARTLPRPDRAIRTLADVVAKSETCLEGGKRGTWVTGGEKLAGLVGALRAGLESKLQGVTGSVLVVVDDPTDALLVTLALATSPLHPVVLAPGSSLPTSLDHDLAAVVKASDRTDLGAALGDRKCLDLSDVDAAHDLVATGRSLGSAAAAALGAEAGDKVDVNEVALTIVSDGLLLPFTHQNLTASLAAWLSLFPASPQATKPTLRDSALSFHHPATPHGFGLALMLVYQSASLSFPPLPSAGDLALAPADAPNDADEALAAKERAAEAWCAVFAPKPAATLVFAPSHLVDEPLYALVLHKILGDSSVIVRKARDGKLRLLREGTVSKQTFWDSLLWKGLRKDIHLTSLRGLFLSVSAPSSTSTTSSSAAIPQSHLDTFRCALGCPVVPLLAHAALLAPIAVANMWDVQRLPPPGAVRLAGDERGHVGAVAAGCEVKLVGEEGDFAKGRVRGELLLRTPLLPSPAALPPHLLRTDTSLPALPPYPAAGQGAPASASTEGARWFRTGVRAEMSTEGTLWLEERKAQ